MVAITGFMIRYGDVLADDLRRMRIARESRAADPRWIWQANAVGRYAHPSDTNTAPVDPDFEGFGVALSDAD